MSTVLDLVWKDIKSSSVYSVHSLSVCKTSNGFEQKPFRLLLNTFKQVVQSWKTIEWLSLII